jgi:F-type H+-transporting ATPase subunit epsilon
VSWRRFGGGVGYCAVRRGVLSVQGGKEIAIATREAELGTDLNALETSVLSRFRADLEAERSGRAAAVRLSTQAIRRIVEALRPERRPEIGG